MKTMKTIGLIFLVAVLVIATVAVGIFYYDKSQQKTPEEMKAEFLSLIKSLEEEELISLLKPLQLLLESDGQYDNDNDLVGLAGYNPSALTETSRAVMIQVLDQNKKVKFVQMTLGWIYSQKYIVAPAALFYVPTAFGRANILETPNPLFNLTLLPDPQKEDEWKKESLGKVRFFNEDFAIIERVNSIIGAPQPKYVLGKYEDLKSDDFLYQITQENSRIQVQHSGVLGTRVEDGKNLINTSGDTTSFQELGALLFAVRDGKFELVGMLSVIGEPIFGESGMVYLHGIDIHQVIAEIERIGKK